MTAASLHPVRPWDRGGPRSLWVFWLVAFLGLGLQGALPDKASARQADALEQADALVRDGRVAPARDLLLDWWESSWADASRQDRERGLWLRGRLTLEPSEASTSYRRILAEYPSGRFADQALMRLGHLYAVQGDTVSAAEWFTILQRDHPGSPARLEARAWLAAPEVQAALERGADERRRPPPPPTPQPPAQTRESGTSEGVPDMERQADQLRYTVQLGAFSTEGRAHTLATQAEQSGFEVRVVRTRGSDLWRVRSGRFENDVEPVALYDRLVNAGYEAAVVSDADREEKGG